MGGRCGVLQIASCPSNHAFWLRMSLRSCLMSDISSSTLCRIGDETITTIPSTTGEIVRRFAGTSCPRPTAIATRHTRKCGYYSVDLQRTQTNVRNLTQPRKCMNGPRDSTAICSYHARAVCAAAVSTRPAVVFENLIPKSIPCIYFVVRKRAFASVLPLWQEKAMKKEHMQRRKEEILEARERR